MEWLGQTAAALLPTLVIAIISFFLKRTLNQIEKRQEVAESSYKAQIEQLKKDTGERQEKIEGKVDRLTDRVNQALQEMPSTYTLREDWMRANADTGRKLDRITDMLISNSKGRQQND